MSYSHSIQPRKCPVVHREITIVKEITRPPQAEVADPAMIRSTIEFTEDNFIALRQDVVSLRLVVMALLSRMRDAGIIDETV
uniref:Uncharacterized protein n=1 Tax=viral metagenome TaxID=1070528 RepID=A0A6C0LY90_9ZZZZ